MIRKFLIWSYNTSAAGLVAGKVSDDTKVGYSAGALVAGLSVVLYVAGLVAADLYTPSTRK